MDWPVAVSVVLVAALLLFAAWNDVATRLIPDCIPLGVACIGALVRLKTGFVALGMSAGLALAVFALLAFAHARGALGGGDVKLAAAVCLGLSPPQVWRFVVVTALAGGVLAVLHLIARRLLRGVAPLPPRGRVTFLPLRVLRAERWRIARHGSLSYGVAIAFGGIWALLDSRGF